MDDEIEAIRSASAFYSSLVRRCPAATAKQALRTLKRTSRSETVATVIVRLVRRTSGKPLAIIIGSDRHPGPSTFLSFTRVAAESLSANCPAQSRLPET
jgi:hypothetical protein